MHERRRILTEHRDIGYLLNRHDGSGQIDGELVAIGKRAGSGVHVNHGHWMILLVPKHDTEHSGLCGDSGAHGYLLQVVSQFDRVGDALVDLSTSARLSMLLKQRQPKGDAEDIVDTMENFLDYLHRFALVDEAGGKSVILQQLAVGLARQALAASTADPNSIPLYVRAVDLYLDLDARAFDSVDLNTLVTLTLRQLGGEIPGAHAEVIRALHEGRAVLLIDGLDEVPSTETGWRIMHSMRAVLLNNRAIVSLRPEAEPAVVGWPICSFQRLHKYQRRALIERILARAQEVLGVTVDASPLEADIETHEAIRLQASNPLLLTLMTVVYAQRGHLPSEMETEN